MFGHPKDNFLPKKARLNFEVYGQNRPITPEAGEKKGSFIKLTNHPNLWGKKLCLVCILDSKYLLEDNKTFAIPNQD